jgi:pyruvate dehydrogenase E2 component (dihydrolipoamide acetyltransferase)
VLAAGEEAPAPVSATAAREEARSPRRAQATRPARRDGRRPLASPKARKLAEARGIDVAALRGSGPNGAVVAADVEAASEPASSTPLHGRKGAGAEVGSVWRAMARHTTESWQQVPHFYLRRDVDATRLRSWRDVARSRPGCDTLTFTDLLVRVAAEALARHPRVNASWRDGTIVDGDGVNVGIAVATEDGLVAPVVHGADRLDLAALVARRQDAVVAAREGRLKPADVEGGTFTVSNLGMYGVDSFDAIVNAPQAAILAVGRVRDEVVAVDGQPAVRPTLSLTVSFDHRVVDGARGAEFLDTLASLLEEPAGLVQ